MDQKGFALPSMQIGSVVRAPLPDNRKSCRRSVIATINDGESPESNTATVIWEDEAPRLSVVNLSSKPLIDRFLVVPNQSSKVKKDDNMIESTIPVNELMPLFDFEQEEKFVSSINESGKRGIDVMESWKDKADQLLRAGDASVACVYYEVALQCCCSKPEIGGTIILKVDGYAKVAEIDCVEKEDSSMDVTIVGTGEEKSIKSKEVLLFVPDSDGSNLQERILLNLTRCLLQLAELSQHQDRLQYLKSAVLGCTLSIALSEFYRNNANASETLISTEKTALLLRSQAYSKMSKLPHAFADIKRLLKFDPQHKEGQKWLQTLERQKLQQKKTDKRLSKEVSRWVQTAMGESVSSQEDKKTDIATNESSQRSNEISASKTNSSIPWIPLVLVAILAWMIQSQFA